MSDEHTRPRGAGSEPVSLRPGMDARAAARAAEIEQWAWRRMRALRGFFIHLTIYALVNFGFLLVDVFTPGNPWFFYPLLGWGLFVGLHAAQVYEKLPWFTRRWEERKVQELIDEADRR
jgi:hypothetical protein